MTTPETRAAAPTNRCSAEIEVHFSSRPDGGVFRFVVAAADDVTVSEDGSIHLPRLGPDERARIAFILFSDTGGVPSFEGIRLGDETQVKERPPALDTREEYYFDTPFKVGSAGTDDVVLELVLTQYGPLVPSGVDPYFYELGVKDRSGRTWRHDPKIYNEGDGGPR